MNQYSGDITKIAYPPGCVNIIPQVCNNIGKYGAGLSGSLATKWPIVRERYSEWVGRQGKGSSGPYTLGQIQWVNVEPNVAVVNMVAQNGVRNASNPKPIKYKHLEMCLIRLFGMTSVLTSRYADGHFKIWCPQIGAGLAGGDWQKIQGMVAHWFDRPEFELNIIYYEAN